MTNSRTVYCMRVCMQAGRYGGVPYSSDTEDFASSPRSRWTEEQHQQRSTSTKTHQVSESPRLNTNSLCLDVVSTTRTVVPGLFRSLVRRSGTHCSQMNSEIRRVMSTASNSSLKQSRSALTSVTSALEVIFNVMRSIKSTFYLLTYLLRGLGLNLRNFVR